MYTLQIISENWVSVGQGEGKKILSYFVRAVKYQCQFASELFVLSMEMKQK